MLKKILIAAVAVVAGLIVVNRSSLIKALWNDAKCCMERQVPPEVQLKQLKVEIAAIDKDIKKNLSRLAAQEVDVKELEGRVEGMKSQESNLRADMLDMMGALKPQATKVVFKGHSYRASELTRKLDRDTSNLRNLQVQIKSNEQILQAKKQALEAAHSRISEMCKKKEEFNVIVAQMETHLAQLKTQQLATRIELDDSQVARCNEMINKLKTRLATEETEAQLLADYGFSTPAATVEKDKTTEEVLKAARQALQDNREPEKVAVEK